MTSINNLMNTTSTSSIYGNRNIISGLASGMDTETMIENAVKGYQSKITSLQQKQEQVQWKQEAYRSIIDKMVNLTRKYTSYTSSTNLFSQSFFNKAVTSVTNGVNAGKVSATGKTSSDIQINGVKQLAQAARRAMNVSNTILKDAVAQTVDGKSMITADAAMDLSGNTKVSDIAGGMTLKYGGSSVYLDFGELETFEADTYDNPGEGGTVKSAAEKLADAINKKLEDAQVKTGKGDYVKASDRIKAVVSGDKITFEDKAGAGNNIAITGATKGMQDALGFKAGDSATSMTVNADKLFHEVKTTEYLSNKNVSFTLDGVTKTVSLGTINSVTDVVDNLQKELDSKFGSGKITVGNDNGKLSFQVAKGSNLAVTSEVGEALGIGQKGVTTSLDTGKTLKELGLSGLFDETSTNEASVRLSDLIKLSADSIGNDNVTNKEKLTLTIGEGENAKKIELNLGEMEYTTDAQTMVNRFNAQLEAQLKEHGLAADAIKVGADAKGNITFTADANTSFTIDSSNPEKADIYTKSAKMQNLEVNGKSVGKFTEQSTLAEVMSAINNSDTGIKLNYSRLTNEFTMEAKETGAGSQIEMTGNLAEMFGFGGGITKGTGDKAGLLLDEDGNEIGKYTDGQDAIFTATVNGSQLDLTRASNTFDMDGMSVTLQDTFGVYKADGTFDVDAAENKNSAVTFTTSADTETIVSAIKDFVKDYNEMVKEIHDAYRTMPNEKSSKDHSRYLPLTEEDKKGMTESAIKAYEEKAKQGILFGSTELSNLYRQLTSAVQNSGLSDKNLKAIGISTSYSNGLTTLELDEKALTEALNSDPDKVRDAFAKSADSGAGSDGLMGNLKTVLDAYANTTTGSMGILIQQAGSSYSPSSVNSNYLQKQYDEFTKQIEKWQTKMSDRVDYYTRQFTALEQLVAQMNNQSSMLAGLQGGY